MSTPSGASVTNRSHSDRRSSHADYRPLLSHATILIFSGFLIGLVSSRMIVDDFRVTIMAAGIVGLLSFVAFDQVRTRRKEHAEARDKQFVEGRLERHVDRCTAGCDDFSSNTEDSQLPLEAIPTAD